MHHERALDALKFFSLYRNFTGLWNHQSTSFEIINSFFFLACFALIALIADFEQNIRGQLSQVKFML